MVTIEPGRPMIRLMSSCLGSVGDLWLLLDCQRVTRCSYTRADDPLESDDISDLEPSLTCAGCRLDSGVAVQQHDILHHV